MAGDIVAKLGIDGRGWSSGLSTARGQMTSFVGAATRAFAPLGAALGAAFGVKESVAAYQTQLTNARKLNSVLAATGGAAGLTGQQIADYAAELQKTTNFEDDATVAAAAMLASFTNIRGDTFKGAIAGAMDMSAVLGTDLTSNVQLLGKALNDPIDGLSKLGRSGIQFTESQRQQIETLQKSGHLLEAQGIILDTVAGKFGGAAEATAEPFTQLQNTIGDVAENIGSMMLPSLTVGADALTEFLGVVVAGADSFKEFGIEAAVELSHLGGLIKLTSLDWSIALVEWLPNGEAVWQTLGATIHATLEGSKAAAKLFISNFKAGLSELKNFGAAVFDSFGAALTALASGENPFTAMSNTFRDTLAKQIGPEGGKNFAVGFAEAYKKAYAGAMQGFSENGGMLKGLKGERDALAGTLAESMEKQRKELNAKFSPNGVIPGSGAGEIEDFSKDKKDKADRATKSEASAAFLGSKEAAQLMTRGISSGPIKVADNPLLSIAGRQYGEQKKTTDEVRKLGQKGKGSKEPVLFFEEPGLKAKGPKEPVLFFDEPKPPGIKPDIVPPLAGPKFAGQGQALADRAQGIMADAHAGLLGIGVGGIGVMKKGLLGTGVGGIGVMKKGLVDFWNPRGLAQPGQKQGIGADLIDSAKQNGPGMLRKGGNWFQRAAGSALGVDAVIEGLKRASQPLPQAAQKADKLASEQLAVQKRMAASLDRLKMPNLVTANV